MQDAGSDLGVEPVQVFRGTGFWFGGGRPRGLSTSVPRHSCIYCSSSILPTAMFMNEGVAVLVLI